MIPTRLLIEIEQTDVPANISVTEICLRNHISKMELAAAVLEDLMGQRDCIPVRGNNDDLHLEWALQNLVIIDECIEKIGNISQLSMLDLLSTMQYERNRLVKEEAAYIKADKLLKIVRGKRDGSA